MGFFQQSQQTIATFGLAALMTLGTVGNVTLSPLSTLSAEASPAVSVASTVSGEFTDVAHTTTGSASIVTEGNTRYLELSEEFNTDSGPDLFVLLHRSDSPQSYDESEYVNLGMLEQVSGTQRYRIPEDINVEDFRSAVIWCRQFDVTFGFAVLG